MGGEEMNRYALFFVGLGLASTLLEAEDLGQKINSYAVKDGKKVWEEDRFGNRTEFEYDRAGQLVNTRRSGMSVSGNVYKNGLLKEQRTIFGAVVKMNYDAQGRLVEKLTSGRKAEQKYDKYGRMVERKGAGEYPLKFAYTGWGELAGYTDGNGSTTKFEYDKSGKLIKRIWPDGTPVKYGYANGRLVSKEEAGRKTTYQYDTFGRMTEEKIVQGKESLTTKMTYDENGRMSSITDGKTTVKFAYDRFGRKLLEDGPVGTLTMMYDEKGRLSAHQVQFKGKNEKFTTEYKYDEYDRVVTVKSPSGEFHYTWTKDNKIATQSIGDKKVVNTYDKAGRLISKTFGDTVLAKYEYDSLDRRIKGQYFDVKWDYSYDQYNQLIGAKNSNGDSYQYEYDSIGNRLKAVENGKTREFSYNKLNQISNDGYAYDAWGNMTKTPDAEYSYDLKNRLTKVHKNDGTLIEYQYDPLAQRISSLINKSKKNYYFMVNMIEYARYGEKTHYHTLGLDMNNSLKDTGGGVAGILATNQYKFLYDGGGNIIAIYKEDNINVLKSSSPLVNSFFYSYINFMLYATKAIDTSSLVYYGYRFYNSDLGIWLTRDPIGESGGMALYSFVNNSPINFFDIKGLVPCCNGVAIPDGKACCKNIDTGIESLYDTTEECCCQGKRFLNKLKGTGIKRCVASMPDNLGNHAWIETPSGSAGFYPYGDPFAGNPGMIVSPDKYSLRPDKTCYEIQVNPCKNNLTHFTSAIDIIVGRDSSSPPTYNPATFNCHTWAFSTISEALDFSSGNGKCGD